MRFKVRFDALDLAKRLDLETRLWHWDIKKCQAGLERQVLLVVKQKDCTSAEHHKRHISSTVDGWDVLRHVYGCVGFYSSSHLDPVALH